VWFPTRWPPAAAHRALPAAMYGGDPRLGPPPEKPPRKGRSQAQSRGDRLFAESPPRLRRFPAAARCTRRHRFHPWFVVTKSSDCRAYWTRRDGRKPASLRPARIVPLSPCCAVPFAPVLLKRRSTKRELGRFRKSIPSDYIERKTIRNLRISRPAPVAVLDDAKGDSLSSCIPNSRTSPTRRREGKVGVRRLSRSQTKSIVDARGHGSRARSSSTTPRACNTEWIAASRVYDNTHIIVSRTTENNYTRSRDHVRGKPGNPVIMSSSHALRPASS
jgi:hypothetical protein